MRTAPTERTLAATGGCGTAVNATRAGYLPVPLAHVPPGALHGLALYVRATNEDSAARSGGTFIPYRTPEQPLTTADIAALRDDGLETVYIRVADQGRFREQLETLAVEMAGDSGVAVATRATLIYETSLELVNELLADPDWAGFAQRLGGITRAIVTLVLNEPTAFPHLLTVSHHDFYTATHMVNVATALVPLARELGYTDPRELGLICQAGLLHDIGKVYVPQDVLNKPGALSDEDWWLLRRHPELGWAHLKDYAGIDPLVPLVARQHHERLDGSGYPDGLRADGIHPISRLAAVVDTFDAMTAFRPFKQRTLSVPQALAMLKRDAPLKYDKDAVDAWARLVETAVAAPPPDSRPGEAPAPAEARERRQFPRFRFSCPARLHRLETQGDRLTPQPGVPVVAHSISQSGLGVLSHTPVPVGQAVRVYLMARVWNHEYVEAQVVRCRRYQDGWHELGLHFTGRGTDPLD